MSSSMIDQNHLNYLIDEFGDVFVIEVCQVFLDTAPAVVDALIQAVAQEDDEQIKVHAHKLKGMAMSLSLGPLAELVTQHDKNAYNASFDHQALGLELQPTFKATCQGLKNFQASLA